MTLNFVNGKRHGVATCYLTAVALQPIVIEPLEIHSGLDLGVHVSYQISHCIHIQMWVIFLLGWINLPTRGHPISKALKQVSNQPIAGCTGPGFFHIGAVKIVLHIQTRMRGEDHTRSRFSDDKVFCTRLRWGCVGRGSRCVLTTPPARSRSLGRWRWNSWRHVQQRARPCGLTLSRRVAYEALGIDQSV